MSVLMQKTTNILSVSGVKFSVDTIDPGAFKPGIDVLNIGRNDKFKINNKKR